MTALYNENDPAAAHILQHMIDIGVIAPGVVDTRSIKDLTPDDLKGYTQVHLFAGGGFWSCAARLAGWPDDEPLWTASCPCQPFSAAGQGAGTDDPRHLWPDVYRLARATRPAVIMGEQVAAKAGYGWFDGVRTDMAREGYASRSVDFPACSVDAPHQRNRQYWISMANAEREERGRGIIQRPGEGTEARNERASNQSGRTDGSRSALGDPYGAGLSERKSYGGVPPEAGRASKGQASRGPVDEGFGVTDEWRRTSGGHDRSSYWSDAEWITCHDDKARRTKPGLRFLVDGLPGRVDLWRVGGNAIVPEAAREVIAAFIDVYGLPSTWR